MLQQVLDDISTDPLSEDDIEDHLEEDYSDSHKYLLEIDEKVPNEVTDTLNEPVPQTSNKSFDVRRAGSAGLHGGRGSV